MKIRRETIYICEGCGRESNNREDIGACEASTPDIPEYVRAGKEVLFHVNRAGDAYSRVVVTSLTLRSVKQIRNRHCWKIGFERAVPVWTPHATARWTLGFSHLLDPEDVDGTWEDITGRELEALRKVMLKGPEECLTGC